jgi:hypothetical protein
LVGANTCDGAEIADIGGIVDAVAACWTPPPGLAGLERVEQTVRFSLTRAGAIIGEPRVTFVTAAPDSRARELLVQAARDAVVRCTPLKLTPGLGGAIAGRPIAVRLIYHGLKGRGI